MTMQVVFLWATAKSGLVVTLDDQLAGVFSVRQRTIYLFPSFAEVNIYFEGSVSDRYEDFERYAIDRFTGKGVYLQLFTEDSVLDL